MNKCYPFLFLSLLLLNACANYGQLELLTYLPNDLNEVSGIEKTNASDLLWMHNDSGNKAMLFGINNKGEILKELTLKVKNYDWEDITSDGDGNMYIADFGNNNNKRKNLVIYKVAAEELEEQKEVTPEAIKFSYPNQTKFPPKKKDRFFDAESLLYANGFLYVFTKSRVKEKYGKTSLYKLPNSGGTYVAKYIAEYTHCSSAHCVITAAAISPDKQKVVLLTHQSVLVFTNFKGDDFFSGTVKEYAFNHVSQKEGVTFVNNTTLYITDEAEKPTNSRLYKFEIEE